MGAVFKNIVGAFPGSSKSTCHYGNKQKAQFEEILKTNIYWQDDVIFSLLSTHWRRFRKLITVLTVFFIHILNLIHISVFFSHKDQDQGGQTREHGSQGDPAEEEKNCKAGPFEEEGPEATHSIPEERSRLPLHAARKSRKHIPYHGTQGGQTVPSHWHSQVGQIQQGV